MKIMYVAALVHISFFSSYTRLYYDLVMTTDTELEKETEKAML